MQSLLLGNQYPLAWAEYGLPEGEPVFYFHALSGSRLEAMPADVIARDLGIRLIVPDRPGYGDSDHQEDFSLLDWPDVIAQLADRLNLSQFSIIGYSAGGMYALACAYKIPDQIKHVTLVGALAPFETDVMQEHLNATFKPLFELAAADYSAAIQQAAQLASSAEALLEMMQSEFPASDNAIFAQTHHRQNCLQNLTLALDKGVNGVVNDLRSLTLARPFELNDIHLDIDIWHGRDDKNVGFAVAEYLAKVLPNNATHFLENKGHCFIFEQWRDILENLKSRVK